MAVYTPLILYLNHKHLPKSARPHFVNTFFLIVAAVIYNAFAVWTVWAKVSSMIGS